MFIYALLGQAWEKRGKGEQERQRDRETERQRDRETERQRDRETERQRDCPKVITLSGFHIDI